MVATGLGVEKAVVFNLQFFKKIPFLYRFRKKINGISKLIIIC